MRRFSGEHLWQCHSCSFHPEGLLCLSAGLNFVSLWHRFLSFFFFFTLNHRTDQHLTCQQKNNNNRNMDASLLTLQTKGVATSAQFLPGDDHHILVSTNCSSSLAFPLPLTLFNKPLTFLGFVPPSLLSTIPLASVMIFDVRKHSAYLEIRNLLEEGTANAQPRNGFGHRSRSASRVVEALPPCSLLETRAPVAKSRSQFNKFTKRYEQPFVGHAPSGSDGSDLRVHSTLVSPDGLLLITSASDDTHKVWDLRTGEGLATFTGARLHGTQPSAAQGPVLTTTGRHLLSNSCNGMVYAWEMPLRRVRVPSRGEVPLTDGADLTSNFILSAPSSPSTCLCCALSDTNSLFVTGSNNGYIHIHSVTQDPDR